MAELVPIARSQLTRTYHVRLLPKLVLLDQHGYIVGRYRSVADLAAAPELNSPATAGPACGR